MLTWWRTWRDGRIERQTQRTMRKIANRPRNPNLATRSTLEVCHL